MWKINKCFLKQQIALGRSFVLTNDYIFGFLYNEVAYLTKPGIPVFMV